MLDLLKVVILMIVLFFVYQFLQGYVSNNAPLSTNLQGTLPLEISDEELWGNVSPLRGTVAIHRVKSTPNKEDVQEEYLYIEAPYSNSEAIDLTGWSFQSLLSDTRVYIPPATLILTMTGQNDIQPVHLAPGEYAILHSGYSPIANITTSFHTNTCIGYIANFNDFIPKIRSQCTDPTSILPATPENVKSYGATCIEFFNEAQSCKSYTTEMPAHLLPICRDLIARKLTYHSCLSEGLENDGYDIFNNGGWYLYLNHPAEVWRNNYEVIRLLDKDGLVVDVLRY